MTAQAFTPEQRAAICERDGWCCARCGGDVANAPRSIQHRKPRGMGGTRDPRSSDLRNGVLMCGTGTTGCHGAVESNRAKAYATGWLLRSYDELDEPLAALDGRRIHLDADGSRRDDADTDHALIGSLADAIDRALVARRAALTQKETP